jgi:hypothetical protein
VTAAELVREVEARGGRLELLGPERLRLVPRSAATPELLEELRAAKPRLLEILRSPWPEECLEAERRFGGQPHARLFPLLGLEVATPRGRGVLVQVFAERAAVVLRDRAVFFDVAEIAP